ncbi:3-hydroxyacyl-CoA dehydrogenase [Arthrobacter sp. I2-34]|uniref:3-hydroxyacyl-CoA dehydrogenase n=1 Tax=Arthrobacter hankyongi TaxID=2904801 RepID=A0ABS9L291_9MICC|nr:3-hydroxyacyl-CoA dehydrogenase [Arthrobacter hankyongi]MCG2620776.1 3-hydroxyacyl-CoA dehydrogenase [Arthrobacter hankyongi]
MSEHAGPETVALTGMGSIGVAFAVVFARAGFTVQATDPDAGRLGLVRDEVSVRLEQLARHGLLAEEPAEILARVRPVGSLADAVAGAALVQECAPERVDLKRGIFSQLDELAAPGTVLASSSSALTASAFAAQLPGRARVLVAHPGNPPYLLPVIELVPAPFTDPAAVDAAERLYTSAGLSPVRLNQEIEGFLFNRLQGAVLREAYCLVRDGIASAADVDKVVSQGLGLRWSFMGPFETVDLNTRGGIESHAAKMGPAYALMGAQRGQHDPWTEDLVRAVAAERRTQLPLAGWESRVAWRDEQLMKLIHFKEETTP